MEKNEDLTIKSISATFRHYEAQVNFFLIKITLWAGGVSGQEYASSPDSLVAQPSSFVLMIHHPFTVKFHIDLFNRIVMTAATMGMKPHGFVVKAVEEILNMIDKEGREKVPFLVVQARSAQKYVQEAPPLPDGSNAKPPAKQSEPRKRPHNQ